jgi:nicotinamide-nucleotide amidase
LRIVSKPERKGFQEPPSSQRVAVSDSPCAQVPLEFESPPPFQDLMTETLSPVLSPDVERLVAVVAEEACRKGLRLVTAESCTAGLLASLLTDIEGCSHAFDRGFVAYTDEAKHQMIGVPKHLLSKHGAVSAEVAKAMAEGALAHSEGDVALSITGFAGPGSQGEEPGLVFLALARQPWPTEVREEHFGDIGRGAVRVECLRVGLEMLRRSLV